jgi:hypothetical protein
MYRVTEEEEVLEVSLDDETPPEEVELEMSTKLRRTKSF